MSPLKPANSGLGRQHSPAAESDFEGSDPNSPTFDMPSQHSGFRSDSILDMESEPESTDSAGPWSPPAWRRPGSGWFQNERLGPAAAAAYQSHASSRHSSPLRDDPDITLPARVPLPGSPVKGRSPSPSPEPGSHASSSGMGGDVDAHADSVEEKSNNYIRFAVRAEVQHRTEPIEAVIKYWRSMTRTWTSTFICFGSIILSAMLIQKLLHTPAPAPGPDLIKVAGLAKGFEPMIHYSENGVAQIGELQETGVAVWDLGESVRQSNMTSAPIIVKELDDLSGSLKTLAIEMTKFFATVDGDIDSILIVMDWAKRELSQLLQHSPSTVSSAIENLSSLARSAGAPDFSPYLHSMLGMTHADISKATLSRTFHEFLGVLEDSITEELRHSTALFALFEASDRQFQNLQRSVARETNSQESLEDAELSTLWRKLLGGSESRLRKYQKNQDLLRSVRERTVKNKFTLVEHSGRLLALRANLDQLRQRLVSPLVRSENGSTVSIADQIAGLDSTYEFLRLSRERQKSKNMERLYGLKGERRTIGEENSF